MSLPAPAEGARRGAVRRDQFDSDPAGAVPSVSGRLTPGRIRMVGAGRGTLTLGAGYIRCWGAAAAEEAAARAWDWTSRR